jgi:ribonuclease HI
MSKTKKVYVVWQGRNTGIFHTWESAKAQIEGFAGAKYKSFEQLAEAYLALEMGFQQYYIQHPVQKTAVLPNKLNLVGRPLPDSISVDAACKGNPGILEYQGVETISKKRIFSMGPFPQGTVNIGEFLAIVHGLAFLKKHDSKIPIYSDSKTAIAWIKKKQIKTNLERSPKNEALFELVDRAEKWLKDNVFPNKILKWETEFWGENPADYGRK